MNLKNIFKSEKSVKQENVEQGSQGQGVDGAKEVDVKSYKDPEGLSDKKLNFGLWFVEHKKNFRLGFIGFLIVIGAVTWAWTIYSFAYYFAKGMDEENMLAEQIVQTSAIGHDYIVRISAKDLIYSSANIIKTGQGKYDLFILIRNPNKKHWAQLSYCFTDREREVKCGEDFILPNEEKYIMSLANDFQAKPTNIKFSINNLNWKRIDRHEYPDWEEFRDKRLDILVNNEKFTPARATALSGKLNLNNLEFTAENNTAYNYWEVVFNIILFRGNTIVGVNKYIIEEFMSGEERFVEMNWAGSTIKVDKVEVGPTLNIIRKDIYIEYEGEIY